MRRLATFLLWLGLFGLFLAFAAYSVGENQAQLAISSAVAVALAWLVLRRPARSRRPERRFKTLRRLGLVGRAEDEQDKAGG